MTSEHDHSSGQKNSLEVIGTLIFLSNVVSKISFKACTMCFIDNGINVLFYRWLQWTEKQVIICPLFFPFVWPVKNWFHYGDCSVKEREEEDDEEEEEDENRKSSNMGEEISGLPSGDLWSHWGNAIDPIHKWRLFYFCSVIVQISLPSLNLDQELFFNLAHDNKAW